MKKIKMVLYGEPGVGKSVFASKAPKPFFITTDGNYEWLEDFGAKEEDHIQVYSWNEAKDVFSKLSSKEFDKYETIVIDLLEDMFKWCEYEYCKRNKMDHISDVGYGKGYDITRTEFFIEMCKLIGLNKHVIFITHGITTIVKDRRGVENTKYGPTDRIPSKVMDMIEGRVRYFLRCYLKAETLEDGTVLKKRCLSLIPKENEFGIHRGVDESKMPYDIDLDFDTFAECIGLYDRLEIKTEDSQSEIVEAVKEQSEIRQKRPYHRRKSVVEFNGDNGGTIDAIPNVVDDSNEQPDDSSIVEPSIENPAQNETVEKPAEAKELTQQEKIELIKAKLAAMRYKK